MRPTSWKECGAVAPKIGIVWCRVEVEKKREGRKEGRKREEGKEGRKEGRRRCSIRCPAIPVIGRPVKGDPQT